MAEIHSISIAHSDPEIVKKVTQVIISPFISHNDFTVANLRKTELRKSVIELGYSVLLPGHSAQLLIEKIINKALNNKVRNKHNWGELDINVNNEKLSLPSGLDAETHETNKGANTGSACFRKGSPIDNASKLYSSIHGKDKRVEGMALCGIVARAVYEQVFTIREAGNTLTVDSEEDAENFIDIFSSITDSIQFCAEIEIMPNAEKERLKEILSDIINQLSS